MADLEAAFADPQCFCPPRSIDPRPVQDYAASLASEFKPPWTPLSPACQHQRGTPHCLRRIRSTLSRGGWLVPPKAANLGS